MSLSANLLKTAVVLLISTLLGFIYGLGFEATSSWIAAVVAVGGYAIIISSTRPLLSFFAGIFFGAGFWLPLIDWLTLYLGPIPWLALSSVMILWFGIFALLFAFFLKSIAGLRVSFFFKNLLLAFMFAASWATREMLQSSFPYGGFAWGRLAHTQAEGPFVELVSWVGFAGLSGLIAFLSAFVAFQIRAIIMIRPLWSLKNVTTVAMMAIVIFLLWITPAYNLQSSGQVNVVAIQGNSKSGLFDDRESGSVIADHIEVTDYWLTTDPPKTDAIVWPENSAEFNLPYRPENLSRVLELSKEANAPLVIGSILGEKSGAETIYTNSSLVIESGSSEVQRYDKRHPVPFAEYMPHRAFYRAIVPDLVDMVGLEYQHGQTKTVFNLENMNPGIAICFDIIFDQHAKRMSADGADIIFAQTNNADFGKTVQSDQQLQIARLRAVEMGRSLVNISTVATSEIISSGAVTLAAIDKWQPGFMQADVALYDGLTPAMKYGSYLSASFILTTVASAFYILLVGYSRRKPEAR